MRSQNQWIEWINQVNDYRNQAVETGLKGDERRMKLIWTHDRSIEDEERDLPEIQALGDVDEITVTVEFPAKFTVCDVCEGKGSYVNPSIDAGGITEDDEFWDDEENVERYYSGGYDVTCRTCCGKRVTLTIDRDSCNESQKLALKEYDSYLKDMAEYAAERRAERRMGA